MAYTYTIFDGDFCGGNWPSHTQVVIEADSVEEAIDDVRDVLSGEAAGLNPSDGYAVGQIIHANVWTEDGAIVGQPTYELTAEDLGVEEAADINAVAAALSGIVEIKIDGDDRAHVTNHAPDSSDPEYDGDTTPGSAWDEECDARLAEIRESLPSGWSAEWSDDDVIIEREVVS